MTTLVLQILWNCCASRRVFGSLNSPPLWPQPPFPTCPSWARGKITAHKTVAPVLWHKWWQLLSRLLELTCKRGGSRFLKHNAKQESSDILCRPPWRLRQKKKVWRGGWRNLTTSASAYPATRKRLNYCSKQCLEPSLPTCLATADELSICVMMAKILQNENGKMRCLQRSTSLNKVQAAESDHWLFIGCVLPCYALVTFNAHHLTKAFHIVLFWKSILPSTTIGSAVSCL